MFKKKLINTMTQIMLLKYSINYGVQEMVKFLKNNKIKKNLKSITMKWYSHLDSKGKFLRKI